MMMERYDHENFIKDDFIKESFMMECYFSMYREYYYDSLGKVNKNGGIYRVLLHTAIFGPVSLEQVQDMFEPVSVFFDVTNIKVSDTANAYYHTLRRIVLKGFLKKKLHKKRNYYSLTTKGFEFLYEHLSEKYAFLTDYKEYYREKLQVNQNMQQLVHNDTIAKHYVYMARNNPFMFEKVRLSFLINEKGSVFSNSYLSKSQALKIDSIFNLNPSVHLEKQLAGSFVQNGAVLKEPVFVENDQSTENLQVIGEKLAKYASYYLKSGIYNPYSSLFFTISGRNDFVLSKDMDFPSMNTFRIYRSVLDTLIFLRGNELESSGRDALGYYRTITATTALSVLESYKDNLKGFMRYKAALNFYKNYLKILENKQMLYEEAMNDYEGNIDSASVGGLRKDFQNKLDKYIQRRNSIFMKVLENEIMCEEMKKGFRVLSSSNLEPGFAMPFIFPNLYCVDYLDKLMEKMFSAATLSPFLFYPMKNVLLLDGSFITFRNCFEYRFDKKQVQVIVENISDDVSGFYRVLSFIESEGYFHNGIFLLLTDAYQTNLDKILDAAKRKRVSSTTLFCSYAEFKNGIYHKIVV